MELLGKRGIPIFNCSPKEPEQEMEVLEKQAEERAGR